MSYHANHVFNPQVEWAIPAFTSQPQAMTELRKFSELSLDLLISHFTKCSDWMA